MNATNIQANQNAINNQANMNATNIQANMSATNNQASMNTTNIQANQNTTKIQANHKAEEISGGPEDDDDSIQDKESNQSSEDEDIGNLTTNNIATVRAAMVAGTTNGMSSPYWSTLVLTSSIAICAALCMTQKLSSFDLVLWNFRNLSFYLQEEPYIFDNFDNSLTQKSRKSLL
jgi:hypothetical protein